MAATLRAVRCNTVLGISVSLSLNSRHDAFNGFILEFKLELPLYFVVKPNDKTYQRSVAESGVAQVSLEISRQHTV